jgi:hypothetical protein
MTLERVLRAAAIIIAILGLVDPVLTLPWSERPVVSVTVVEPDRHEMSALPQGTLSAADANALKARVVAALDDAFDVRDGVIPEAAAVVLIGDGRSPAPSSASIASPTTADSAFEGPAVAAVVPSPIASATRIVRIDAPRRVHLSEAVPVTVQGEARAPRGRTSAIVAHSDGLEVARATHTWRSADGVEQATVALAIPSLQV